MIPRVAIFVPVRIIVITVALSRCLSLPLLSSPLLFSSISFPLKKESESRSSGDVYMRCMSKRQHCTAQCFHLQLFILYVNASVECPPNPHPHKRSRYPKYTQLSRPHFVFRRTLHDGRFLFPQVSHPRIVTVYSQADESGRSCSCQL